MKPSLINYAAPLTSLLIAILFFVLPVVAQPALPADTEAITNRPKVKRVFYGMASFYANKFNGRQTSSGEIFSQKKLTCACNALPLGTWIRVTNLHNGRKVVVKVNDRLHPKMKRVIDLTRSAAAKLGYVGAGLARVKVEVLGKKMPIDD